MVRRLTAVAAILGATTGLDAEELASLHCVRVEMTAVHGVGPVQEIREGRIMNGLRGLQGPARRCGVPACSLERFLVWNGCVHGINFSLKRAAAQVRCRPGAWPQQKHREISSFAVAPSLFRKA
jgi:hypothetical protein